MALPTPKTSLRLAVDIGVMIVAIVIPPLVLVGISELVAWLLERGS
jgi:hypothetical protein